MKKIIISLIFLLYFSDRIKSTKNNSFVATKEWQEIKEGQTIPSGLHIRMNLQTGKKEAKLLDEEEDSNQQQQALSQLPSAFDSDSGTNDDDDHNEDNQFEINVDEYLENQVKKLNKKNTLGLEYSPVKIDKIKRTYRDYNELKKEFEKMKVSVKTDSELITGLIEEFNTTRDEAAQENTSKQFLSILENLNYLVHQIDNALWFIDSGGLDNIILPMIVNQTNRDFRVISLRILGTLTQNNPKAQIKVYEKNFGSYLSNILLKSINTEELNVALYAFGGLLRKFPHCQREILEKTGTKALISVLKKDTELKIKTKVLILIGDLVNDKENVLKSIEIDQEKVNQYRDVMIEEWLADNDYCSVVEEIISTNKNFLITNPTLADDIFDSLLGQKFCFAKWLENSKFTSSLISIEGSFKVQDDEYLMEVGEKTRKLNNDILDLRNERKDEL